jgi:hypothetical protein
MMEMEVGREESSIDDDNDPIIFVQVVVVV